MRPLYEEPWLHTSRFVPAHLKYYYYSSITVHSNKCQTGCNNVRIKCNKRHSAIVVAFPVSKKLTTA